MNQIYQAPYYVVGTPTHFAIASIHNNGNLWATNRGKKSYSTVSSNQLIIQPSNYKTSSTNINFKGIAYVQLNIADIPTNLLNYLPDDVRKGLANLQSLVITAEQKDKAVEVKTVVSKKKNDLAIIKF